MFVVPNAPATELVLLAVVAVAALPVQEPELPDTFPVTFPVSAAVIVPAEKLPEASRATTLEAVFASVASTAKVLAVEPLNVPPLVK
jgi:hypothetical protein